MGRPGGAHEAILAQRQAIGKGNGNRAFNRGVHSPILRVPFAFGQTPLCPPVDNAATRTTPVDRAMRASVMHRKCP